MRPDGPDEEKGEKVDHAITRQRARRGATPASLALALMLAVLLLAASAPAFAQQQPPPAPEVDPPVTGVLEDTGLGDNPGYANPTYGLLDESSGVLVVLESGVYDLSATWASGSRRTAP